MTMCDLEVLDKDHDGRVSNAEFLSYMLVALQKVERSDIDEINAAFQRLDKNKQGYLSMNDIRRFSGSFRQSMYRQSCRALGPQIRLSFAEEDLDGSLADLLAEPNGRRHWYNSLDESI